MGDLSAQARVGGAGPDASKGGRSATQPTLAGHPPKLDQVSPIPPSNLVKTQLSMSNASIKSESPPSKKPRLEGKGSDVVAPSDALPDEDTAAPPSTAAGAHAKPLSALFNPVPSFKGNKGKGKAKAEDGDLKGDFENTLAGLEAAGESNPLITTRRDCLRPVRTIDTWIG